MAAALQSDLVEHRNYVQGIEGKVTNMDTNIGVRFTAVEASITGLNTTMGAAQSVTIAGMQELNDNSKKTIAQIKTEGDSTIEDIKKEFQKHERGLNALFAKFQTNESEVEKVFKNYYEKFPKVEDSWVHMQEKAKFNYENLKTNMEPTQGSIE